MIIWRRSSTTTITPAPIFSLPDWNSIDFHDPTSALPYAQQAVDSDGSNAYAEATLGNVYYTLGKKANALLHYRRYAELIGDEAEPIYLTRIHELETP